jgi:hypothetical protein
LAKLPSANAGDYLLAVGLGVASALFAILFRIGPAPRSLQGIQFQSMAPPIREHVCLHFGFVSLVIRQFHGFRVCLG